MLAHSKMALFVWLLAVALLPIRMANAHLHMCLDGQERQVSVHVEDVPTHTGGANGVEHNDRDIQLADSLNTHKVDDLDDTTLGVLAAYTLAVWLPVLRQTLPAADLSNPDPSPGFELRPPSRGPPL